MGGAMGRENSREVSKVWEKKERRMPGASHIASNRVRRKERCIEERKTKSTEARCS